MNAHELTKDRADILADELLAYHNKGVCNRAAKMLRQQADRIAELEKELDLYKPEDDDNKTVCHTCDGTGLCDRA